MRYIIILFFPLLISTQALAGIFDGKWYGTNPCAIFDEPQDVILEIENGKAKADWGEERNPTKYRGKVYKGDKIGLNSNDGRVEGYFTSTEELLLNKGKTITNNNNETINCEFVLTKNAIKKEDNPEEIAKQKAIEEEEQAKSIMDNIPEWFLNLPDGGNIIAYAAGTNENLKLQTAYDRALGEARETLASSLNLTITQQLNKIVDEISAGNDITLTEQLTEVTNYTTNTVKVSGWKEVEKDIQKNGDNYLVYVLIQFNLRDANKILLDQIKTNEDSFQKLKASQAFQELEEEVNKSS